MRTQPDFEELLALFNANGVEYVIVGAYALALHGVPRATGYLDLYVRPVPENAARIVAALDEFGFSSLDLTPADFTEPDRVVQLGVSPVRVDLLTSLTGVSWEEASAGAAEGTYGQVPVRFLGRDQYVANKRASGRPRDLGDLELLGES